MPIPAGGPMACSCNDGKYETSWETPEVTYDMTILLDVPRWWGGYPDGFRMRWAGAHDEDRTRLSLLDREVTSPDADVRLQLSSEMEDREGVEPILFCGLKSRCPTREATG